MIRDLIDFVWEHKPLTASFVFYNGFAFLLLTGRGYIRLGLYLLGFVLAFIWFTVFCALSLLDSYETSRRARASRGAPRHGKERPD